MCVYFTGAHALCMLLLPVYASLTVSFSDYPGRGRVAGPFSNRKAIVSTKPGARLERDSPISGYDLRMQDSTTDGEKVDDGDNDYGQVYT